MAFPCLWIPFPFFFCCWVRDRPAENPLSAFSARKKVPRFAPSGFPVLTLFPTVRRELLKLCWSLQSPTNFLFTLPPSHWFFLGGFFFFSSSIAWLGWGPRTIGIPLVLPPVRSLFQSFHLPAFSPSPPGERKIPTFTRGVFKNRRFWFVFFLQIRLLFFAPFPMFSPRYIYDLLLFNKTDL